jgi:hypothetical protein
VSTLDDIVALLDDADEQIATADKLHDKALATPIARSPFKTRVKNVLENQRSALDYLAVEVTNRYGKPKGRIYYPLAQSESEFPAVMESRMPGVAANKPDIAEAIKRFQPYDARGERLRELNQLTREQKHNRLTAQIVRETYQCEVTELATGASVRWAGLRFEHQMIKSEGGTINFSCMAGRDPALPKPFELAGPTGFQVFGVPVDHSTQRPYPSDGLNVTSGPIERWCFTTPHTPVMLALRGFQSIVRSAIAEIAQAAAL